MELGCGTGRVTRVLAGGARTVVGLDRVPAMLSLARSRLADAPGAHVVRADFRAPPLRSGWPLVAAPDDPLIHLTRDRDRRQALDAAARLLVPGGTLVLDLLWWTPGEVEAARSPSGLRRSRETTAPDGRGLHVEERWTAGHDGVRVQARYRYRPEGGRPVTASFRGRRWTVPELRTRLAGAGLEIVGLSGGYDGRPFEPDGARALLVEARRTDSPNQGGRTARGDGPPPRPDTQTKFPPNRETT